MAHRPPDRILVLDDEEPILFAMREYFESQGYQVDCAKETREAEAFLARSRYSVVTVDLHLGGLDGREGLDLVSIIRERYRETKVIILTAYGSTEVENQALRLGVDAFLHKPKPLPEVEQIVRELIVTSRERAVAP